MIQCEDCEYFKRGEDGQVSFGCDPFKNVKEPHCLQKWQLIKINQMVNAYQVTLEYYRKLAPMQEKMFKVMEREIDELDESEKWKATDEEQAQEDQQEDQQEEGPKGDFWG